MSRVAPRGRRGRISWVVWTRHRAIGVRAVAPAGMPRRQSSKMLTGDLSTMSLADVLQWADSTRARGMLTIARPSGAVWMQIADRCVSGCVRPSSRGVVPQRLAGASERGKLELDQQALALEMLYDQFLVHDDAFRFELGREPAEAGVALDISLQEVVMIGMQYVDEWAEVRSLYASSHARIRRIDAKLPESLSATQQALLVIAEL